VDGLLAVLPGVARGGFDRRASYWPVNGGRYLAFATSLAEAENLPVRLGISGPVSRAGDFDSTTKLAHTQNAARDAYAPVARLTEMVRVAQNRSPTYRISPP